MNQEESNLQSALERKLHKWKQLHTDDGCKNNIKVRNYIPRRELLDRESTLDIQTHNKETDTS